MSTLNRRHFLGTAAGTMAAAASTGLFSTDAIAGKGHGTLRHKLIVNNKKVLAQMDVVRKTAAECMAAGLACIQHCNEELIKGHAKEFRDCAISVNQMTPICEMIATLAASKATVTEEFLEGCIEACEACRDACKAHEKHFAHGMHMECKACMESCIACIRECKKLKSMM